MFEKQGVKLVVDSISYDFLKGATVDYVEELIRSAFQVSRLLCFLFMFIDFVPFMAFLEVHVHIDSYNFVISMETFG